MKLIHTITGLQQIPIIHRDKIYFVDKKQQELVVLDKETFNATFQLKDKVLSISILHDLILCYGLNIYNLDGAKVFSGNAQYSFQNLYYDKLTLWKLVDNEKETVSYHVFDIAQKSFTKRNFALGAVPFLFFENKIYTRKANLITCKNIVNDSPLWQLDITQFGSFKEKKLLIGEEPKEKQREIYRVYYYNNKIIVTLSRAVIALNPENGDLLWKIDFENYNPIELVFYENTAYLGEYVDFVTIDIEKGVKTFERDTTKPMSIVIGGQKIDRFKYTGLVYHENYIWFTQGFEGKQYLLKANPENGVIIEGMLLDAISNTHPPVFDENRVYILDQNGELFIYEEQ